MTMLDIPETFDMAEVLANSYRDFHAKGLDYICLKRSFKETLKLYFFDGDSSRTPEVVNPHDHRYAFDTFVVSGEVANVEYWADPLGKHYNRFHWMTPLNGGAGFKYADQVKLSEKSRSIFSATNHFVPQGYGMPSWGIHTLRVLSDRTVLFLRQYEDSVPLSSPTSTYCLGNEPKLDGLYRRFDADSVVKRLLEFGDRTGVRIAQRLL